MTRRMLATYTSHGEYAENWRRRKIGGPRNTRPLTVSRSETLVVKHRRYGNFTFDKEEVTRRKPVEISAVDSLRVQVITTKVVEVIISEKAIEAPPQNLGKHTARSMVLVLIDDAASINEYVIIRRWEAFRANTV